MFYERPQKWKHLEREGLDQFAGIEKGSKYAGCG